MFGFGRKKERKLVFSSISHSAVGLVRTNNEDHLLVAPELGVYCVADGMGGGADGEKASQIVCAEIAMLVKCQKPEFAVRMEAACTAVVAANESILDYSKRMGFDQMGTTVSMMMIDPEKPSQAAICHVGDSRIYRFRNRRAEPLTRDHSVAVELGDRLGADFTSRSNPLAHVLTRAVGTSEKVCPDWKKITIEAGDRYLFCTDGVHDVVSDGRLEDLLVGLSLEEAKKALITEVAKCGAPDNFSFIILDAEAE